MKSWIIIITFIISITSLLFKTTYETPTGVKKLNKWGFVLLIFMISALIINFLITNADKKETKLKIEKQKTIDALALIEKENRWKITTVTNAAIIERLQSDLLLSNEIKKQQEENIYIQKNFNNFLIEKISSSQKDLNNIRFPTDTLYLSFKITLKCNDPNKIMYYEKLFENDSLYSRGYVNQYQNLLKKSPEEFEKFTDMQFAIGIDKGNDTPTFYFNYKNVPKLLENNYDYHLYNSDEKTTFSTIYFRPNTKELEIYTNRVKAEEIRKSGSSNLKNICNSKCILDITEYGLLQDFDLHIDEIILSNKNNDRKVYFKDFVSQSISNPYFFAKFISKSSKFYECSFE
jgi:hypothetical protein